MKKPDIHKQIHDLLTDLLFRLEVAASIKIEDKDDSVLATIESEEAGILIGHHGRNLEALQIIVAQLLYKKNKTWTHVVLSVGDYRSKREEQLKELAKTTSDKVIETQTPHVLTRLSAAERRIVHMALSENPFVVSESEGEGELRQLVVKPKM